MSSFCATSAIMADWTRHHFSVESGTYRRCNRQIGENRTWTLTSAVTSLGTMTAMTMRECSTESSRFFGVPMRSSEGFLPNASIRLLGRTLRKSRVSEHCSTSIWQLMGLF